LLEAAQNQAKLQSQKKKSTNKQTETTTKSLLLYFNEKVKQ